VNSSIEPKLSISNDEKFFSEAKPTLERQINEWTKEISYTIDIHHRYVKCKISIICDAAWAIDHKRDLIPINNEVTPPFPVGCWLVCSIEEGFWQIDFPKFPHMRFVRTDKGVDVLFPIRDIDSLGIQYWGTDKITLPQKALNLSLWIYRLEALEECAWIEPYPHGAKAALCLTDHADWDGVDKMRPLNDLFERYDFRLTKSIFPHSDPQGNKREPGLDDPAFKKEIDRLKSMGSEIAYHGLSPRVNLPEFEHCLERVESMDSYRPETWIDHGTGEYLFSRQAKFDNGENLVELMAEHGIRNYWSYVDIWENSCTDLNVWSARSIIDSFYDVICLLKRKRKMSGKQFAYITVALLKNLFGGAEYRKLNKIFDRSIRKELMRHYRRLSHLHQNPTVLYGQTGLFAPYDESDLWIFDTILLNHLALQLHPDSIDKLIEENGLLIAHTYMGAQHPYGGSNCFDSDSSEPKLLKSFEGNIAYISEKQKDGQIVTLPFGELRDLYENFLKTRLIREKDRWKTSVVESKIHRLKKDQGVNG